MDISAGLLIIQDNKILLAHPTNAPWYGTYSIPKGKLNFGESKLDAAIRETEEEVGLIFTKNEITNEPYLIEYTNEKDEVYKQLYYYVIYPKEKIKIDIRKLQKDEIDWASFLNKPDAISRIFWRFEEMLNYIE